MELSNFTLGLALHGLQCGMMAKVCDNMRSTLDECRAEGQLEISVEKLNLNQFSKFKVHKRGYIFLS